MPFQPLHPATTDDNARRAYWSTMLDEATVFMRRAVEAEVRETGEPALDITTELPAHLDVEYAGADSANPAGMFFLRRNLVRPLVNVITELNSLGLGMRIEFGYRTPETQAGLCKSANVLGRVLKSTTWETHGAPPDPQLVYERLIVLCANVYKTGTHLGASALDVTVLDRETGNVLDPGGPYLTMDETTPMDSPHVGSQAKRNRALLRGVFARHGFVAYPYEYWHFCAGDVYEALIRQSKKPARYGAVHLNEQTGQVTPVENPEQELVPREVMLERIRGLLASQN